MNKLLLLLILVFCASFQKVSAQKQITDFTFGEDDKGSSPAGFVEFNNLFIFQASTASEGKELWVSDGSQNNTRLLKDIYPGSNDGISSFSQVILNDQLFFMATMVKTEISYGPQEELSKAPKGLQTCRAFLPLLISH